MPICVKLGWSSVTCNQRIINNKGKQRVTQFLAMDSPWEESSRRPLSLAIWLSVGWPRGRGGDMHSPGDIRRISRGYPGRNIFRGRFSYLSLSYNWPVKAFPRMSQFFPISLFTDPLSSPHWCEISTVCYSKALLGYQTKKQFEKWHGEITRW